MYRGGIDVYFCESMMWILCSRAVTIEPQESDTAIKEQDF